MLEMTIAGHETVGGKFPSEAAASEPLTMLLACLVIYYGIL